MGRDNRPARGNNRTGRRRRHVGQTSTTQSRLQKFTYNSFHLLDTKTAKAAGSYVRNGRTGTESADSNSGFLKWPSPASEEKAGKEHALRCGPQGWERHNTSAMPAPPIHSNWLWRKVTRALPRSYGDICTLTLSPTADPNEVLAHLAGNVGQDFVSRWAARRAKHRPRKCTCVTVPINSIGSSFATY